MGVLNGLLYSVGGHDGPLVRKSVESYNPDANRWERFMEILWFSTCAYLSVEKSPVFKRPCPFKQAFWGNRLFFCDFAFFVVYILRKFTNV